MVQLGGVVQQGGMVQLGGVVQLGVHLQVLLLVGLVTFCLCLILGCVLCWKRSKTCPLQDQEPRTPPPPGDTMTLGVQTQSPASPHPPQAGTTTTRQQYEDLDGEVVEYPSTFSSTTPSDDDFTTLPLSSHRSSRGASSEHKEQHPKSYFPLRRLSTPSVSSPYYKPTNSHHGRGRSSFPSLPRLVLISKTRQTLERSCSITGHSLYSERRRLTSTSSYRTPSTCAPEDGHFAPIPLHTLHYGSSCRAPARPAPTLHFTMSFSSEKGTLSITVLSLTRTTHRLGEVSVMASLAPLCPCPLQASTLCSPSLSPNPSLSPGPSPDPYTLGLTLKAGSLEELQRCVLRLAVYTRNLPSLRGSLLGELELQLGGMDWKTDHSIHCTKELNPKKWKLKKSLTSQDAATSRGLSLSPQVQGQLFILLQYQTLAHRIKAMVLQADNLGNLTPGAPDYHVVINLRHDGLVIGTKETKGVGGANTPFLFDLPPGDVTMLPLVMEFIVMQEHVYSNNTVLGRILIGSEAPETGRSHWKDVCRQGQVERARWHTVQPEPLENNKNQSDSRTLGY
ncbi:uncharacterized protein [Salvelinus alpinus]|uniref:uncharacterized protein n=1 Tax=Salvelinus alpinus TaxID=8036 RepID=UPI0039FD054B